LPGGKIIKSSPDVVRSYQQANPGIIVCHWLWPVAPHVDPQKEREADRLGMQNGDTTYADLCARNNRDWRDVIEERKEINAALRAAGLPEIPGIPDPSKAAGAGAAGGDQGAKSQPAQNDGWAGRSADGWAPDREQVLRHLLGINGNGHGTHV
jgi:capsid protein